jgi:cell wall-associated NlpC family hydrolase
MSGLRASAALFITLAAAGCASAPPPRATPPQIEVPPPPPAISADDDQAWDGSGGAAALRARGEQLAAFALSLRGTPYRYGGATREGFDCSGLVFYAHQHFGLTVPRTSRAQADEARAVKPRKLAVGDLVFFKIGSRHVNHVGIYVGKNRFVHAPGAGKPVAINSLEDEFYADKFYSAGRFWDRLPR